MQKLEKRIAALEAAAIVDPDQCGGFDFAPVMTIDQWNAIAPAQQAALIQKTLELATNQRGDAWQH